MGLSRRDEDGTEDGERSEGRVPWRKGHEVGRMASLDGKPLLGCPR